MLEIGGLFWIECCGCCFILSLNSHLFPNPGLPTCICGATSIFLRGVCIPSGHILGNVIFPIHFPNMSLLSLPLCWGLISVKQILANGIRELPAGGLSERFFLLINRTAWNEMPLFFTEHNCVLM